MNKNKIEKFDNRKEARRAELEELYKDVLDVFVKHDNYMVSFDNLFEDAMDKYHNEWDSDFRILCDDCTSNYKNEASYGWMRTVAFMLAWQLMHGRM